MPIKVLLADASDIKPEVLLLDLDLPETCNFAPDFVRSQLRSVPYALALSLSNHTEDEFPMARMVSQVN
jgi:hypothetical protein